MLKIPNAFFDNLNAVKSDGTALVAARKQGQAYGVTFPGAGTWYFPIGSSESSFVADAVALVIQLTWAAALNCVFTLEISNLPLNQHGGDMGLGEVLDWDQTAGDWLPINPASAYGAAAGGGNAYANTSLTAGAANAGGGIIVLPQFAARRARVKAVVAAGALARCAAWGTVLLS